jgi:glucosamine-6-phosphate deaminase
MEIIVCRDYEEMSERAADIFTALIATKPDCVLGLATGSTPIGTYKMLCERYKKGEVDFSRVTTFNLDEYYPMAKDHPQSYHYFMNEQLFSHVNIDKACTHIPDGLSSEPDKMGEEYDRMIQEAGGIDLQLLGIGRNGHIGFNEPAETLIAGTHLTPLTEDTILANARFFTSREEVPTHAVSMGMASILGARAILLLISGKDKSQALRMLREDTITTACPATLLKLHPNVTILCDREAYEN